MYIELFGIKNFILWLIWVFYLSITSFYNNLFKTM